jgi:hypothetical protein
MAIMAPQPRLPIRVSIVLALGLSGIAPGFARADFSADSTNLSGTWRLVESHGVEGRVRAKEGDETTVAFYRDGRFHFRNLQRGVARSITDGEVAFYPTSESIEGELKADLEIHLSGGSIWGAPCYLVAFRTANEIVLHPGGCRTAVMDFPRLVFQRLKETTGADSSAVDTARPPDDSIRVEPR